MTTQRGDIYEAIDRMRPIHLYHFQKLLESTDVSNKEKLLRFVNNQIDHIEKLKLLGSAKTMDNKAENYELIYDYYIAGKINKTQFMKAFGLIRINQFDSIKFEKFGNKITINRKDKK